MNPKVPSNTTGSHRLITALLVVTVVLLIALPLAVHGDSAFVGTDDAARKAVVEIDPAARPWFQPLWSPPGGEVESFLFALQAALGGGVIGYYFGFQRGKRGGKAS